MRRGLTFDTVRRIGLELPGVEVGTMYGSPALKVHSQWIAVMASNKAAEPNTLAVRMTFADRDALIEEAADTYYLKDHYVPYPCVLVRLSRIHPDALRDLLKGAWRFVQATTQSKARPKKRKARQ